jgi:hypothetical protein
MSHIVGSQGSSMPFSKSTPEDRFTVCGSQKKNISKTHYYFAAIALNDGHQRRFANLKRSKPPTNTKGILRKTRTTQIRIRLQAFKRGVKSI